MIMMKCIKIIFVRVLRYDHFSFVGSQQKIILTRKYRQYFRASYIMIASNIYICFADILTYYSACNGSLEQLKGIIRMP